MKVAFCSVFNTTRDGISDYSGYLVDELKKYVEVARIRLEGYIAEDNYYIQKAQEANSADIIHIQFNYSYFNGNLPYRNKSKLFLSRLKKPVVVTMHEVMAGYESIISNNTSFIRRLVFNNTLFFWNFWSRIYHRAIFKLMDKIVVHTKSQNAIIAGLVEDPAKIMIMPHAIPAIREDEKNISSLKAKNELGLEKRIVLTIFGFINKKKGYELVLDCLKRMPDNITLLIAGGQMADNLTDSEYLSYIEEKISAMGLRERVKITGYLNPEDIPRIMAATDICLAPFTSVSASGALSLCIGYNKPIIASDIQGHCEINDRLECLELFHDKDAKDLLGKVNFLLAEQGRRLRLIESTAAYSDKFSYARIAQRTFSLYQEVLEGEIIPSKT